MLIRGRKTVATLLLGFLVVSACSGPTGTARPPGGPRVSASPEASPDPSPTAIAVIAPQVAELPDEQRAIALALASDPIFTSHYVGAGLAPYADDLIGQANWYRVGARRGEDLITVEIQFGWGDCPAGCINRHTWLIAVDVKANQVADITEDGDPIPEMASPDPLADPGAVVMMSALASPVCPVEQVPADPSCEPRPVEGAMMTALQLDSDEASLFETTSDAAGGAQFKGLPAGVWLVRAASEDVGLPGSRPTPDGVIVAVGQGSELNLGFAFDTGIR